MTHIRWSKTTQSIRQLHEGLVLLLSSDMSAGVDFLGSLQGRSCATYDSSISRPFSIPSCL